MYRARFKTFKHRTDIAKARAGGIGYDMQIVRRRWNQTRFEFGVMMGMGVLGELTVERWEMGIEKPPDYVRLWVLRQMDRFKYEQRLKKYYENKSHTRNIG